MESIKQFITETKTEIKGDIKYITHYVNRPIIQGDPHGGAIGACINGEKKTIEVVNYVYQPIN
jgi:hypothetical protein